MGNKYYKNLHPAITRILCVSRVWKRMLEVKGEIEHEIWWQIKARNSNFWFDNWTRQGALYHIEDHNVSEEEMEVKEFITNGEWNVEKLKEYLYEEMILHIIENIKPTIDLAENDNVWWMGKLKKIFIVKSATIL